MSLSASTRRKRLPSRRVRRSQGSLLRYPSWYTHHSPRAPRRVPLFLYAKISRIPELWPGEQKYTYFTSPTCRYVDIVAHRQIATAVRYGNLHDSIRSRRKQGGCAASACGIGTHSSPQGSCKVLRRLGIEGAAHGGGLRNEDIHNGFVVFVPRFGVQGLIQARYLTPVNRRLRLMQIITSSRSIACPSGAWPCSRRFPTSPRMGRWSARGSG